LDIFNRPEKDMAENAKFNYHVSKIRVQSEHCVEFLKGCWSSLHGLQVAITSPLHIRFTCIWITSCIILHTFTMHPEACTDWSQDEFLQVGLTALEEEHAGNTAVDGEGEISHHVGMLEGQLRSKHLKLELLCYLDYKN
ncbi:hypothetical protein K439DRAFT_1331869, partial [Ramaria rubella]